MLFFSGTPPWPWGAPASAHASFFSAVLLFDEDFGRGARGDVWLVVEKLLPRWFCSPTLPHPSHPIEPPPCPRSTFSRENGPWCTSLSRKNNPVGPGCVWGWGGRKEVVVFVLLPCGRSGQRISSPFTLRTCASLLSLIPEQCRARERTESEGENKFRKEKKSTLRKPDGKSEPTVARLARAQGRKK